MSSRKELGCTEVPPHCRRQQWRRCRSATGGAGAGNGSDERSDHGVTGSQNATPFKAVITTGKEARSADSCRLGGCWLSRSLHYEPKGSTLSPVESVALP